MMRLSLTNLTINSTLSPNPQNSQDPKTPPTVAFTTPGNYASRLTLLIEKRKWVPLWCPTVEVEPTPRALIPFLTRLGEFSAIAFTSRAGISSCDSSLSYVVSPLLSLSSDDEELTISALGKDAELLTREFICKICDEPDRVRIIIPSDSTPSGLVEVLGPGLGRKVLCPVPLVVGLEEPKAVPDFLSELGRMGWVAVRANAYETRWAGPKCAEGLMGTRHVDAIVFTSTAEVEGLLKGLRGMGVEWEEVRRRWPWVVVAAHGPVTAAGAERLGVKVDVVSSNFSSFEGIIEALDHTWGS